MFFDEDGDLAHEFYVEVPPARKGCKATMKKVLHNLIPQASTMQKLNDRASTWSVSCYTKQCLE
jgi:hypothetical protein